MKLLAMILMIGSVAGNAFAFGELSPVSVAEISAMKVTLPAPVYENFKGMNSTHRFYASTNYEAQTRLKLYKAALAKAGITVVSADAGPGGISGGWECVVVYAGARQRIFRESKTYISAAQYSKAQAACESRKQELSRSGAIVIEGDAGVYYGGPAPLAYYDITYIK